MTRVLKPGGRLVVLDLTSHERQEYSLQMGHVWQGFAEEQIRAWVAEAGLTKSGDREACLGDPGADLLFGEPLPHVPHLQRVLLALVRREVEHDQSAAGLQDARHRRQDLHRLERK